MWQAIRFCHLSQIEFTKWKIIWNALPTRSQIFADICKYLQRPMDTAFKVKNVYIHMLRRACFKHYINQEVDHYSSIEQI